MKNKFRDIFKSIDYVRKLLFKYKKKVSYYFSYIKYYKCNLSIFIIIQCSVYN